MKTHRKNPTTCGTSMPWGGWEFHNDNSKATLEPMFEILTLWKMPSSGDQRYNNAGWFMYQGLSVDRKVLRSLSDGYLQIILLSEKCTF
ncbi:hypothetical protein [Nostoc sp.]|uniref:hypothetical protein n=1 Tax=Nostoc sp. TaxID=1180 RepID=UPI002FF49E0C